MTPIPPPFSEHTLARWRAGDLPPDRARAVEAECDRSPELRSCLSGLEAAEDAFRRENPWERVAGAVIERAARLPDRDRDPVMVGLGPGTVRRAPSLRSLLACAAGLAAAAALAWGVGPFTRSSGDEPAGNAVPTTRIKGTGGLDAFLFEEGVPVPISPGEVLGPGDRLQFRATSRYRWLVLLGIDGTGTVSRYVPVGDDRSAPFTPGSARPLADSLVLDDAPGPEVFVAFFSDEPLWVEDVERAVHDAADAAGGDSQGALRVDWRRLGLAPQVEVFHVLKEEAR